jgi:hypothetical protein
MARSFVQAIVARRPYSTTVNVGPCPPQRELENVSDWSRAVAHRPVSFQATYPDCIRQELATKSRSALLGDPPFPRGRRRNTFRDTFFAKSPLYKRATRISDEFSRIGERCRYAGFPRK